MVGIKFRKRVPQQGPIHAKGDDLRDEIALAT
jgi:hypothetical protein